MKRYMKLVMILLFSIMISMAIFTPKSYAASSHSLDLTVHTVIDNYDELPEEIKNKEFWYTATRITKLINIGNRALSPDVVKKEWIKWKHGDTNIVSYKDAKTYINTIWFTTRSTRTDSHLSLESVEFGSGSNLRRYTYDDDGYAHDPVSPYDWLEIVDDKKEKAEVTLHFRYNPDIDGIEVEKPEINPSYSKKIDYLGDKISNPGALIEDKNHYRLNLDMNSGEDWRTEIDKEKDIIFVLDISGSMRNKFGNTNRMEALRETMQQAVKSLTENENNLISIIVFDANSKELIRGSNNKDELLKIVNGLTPGNGTNFYDGLKSAKAVVEDNPHRDKSIFFISDGRPNGAVSAGERDILYNITPALSYTNEFAKNFPKVRDFFSIYIGEEDGYASILQTMTQRIEVDKEKYMIKTTNEDQLNSAFERYMSRFGISFRDVTISDELTVYADYAENLKVHMEEKGKDKAELEKDIDYEILAEDNNKISIKLLIAMQPETNYELSFDIRASDKAIEEYESTGIYPHMGDPGTNYPGNMTSAGRAGFYSNKIAELSYNTGSETIVEEYPKPVLQIHEYNPIEDKIEFEKNLTGKKLEADEFEFELREIQTDDDINEPFVIRVGNNADGKIDFGSFKFTKPGRYNFEAKEIIPENKKAGYIYDDRVLSLIVDVKANEEGVLVTSTRYPDGSKFLNKYIPEPISVNFNLQKVMQGKGLGAGDYQFRLFDGNMKSLEVVSNKGNGEIIFSPIELSKVSTYEFIVKEIVPNPSDPDIRYDLLPSNIKVDVFDVDGKLKADVVYSKEKFVNRYIKEEVKVDSDLEFKVLLTGMQLSPNMFEFELEDENGTKYKTTNRSDGDIIFEDIRFENIGDYKYTAKQIISDNPMAHMDYDKETREINIKVSEGVGGELITDIEYTPDNIFHNGYKNSGRIW